MTAISSISSASAVAAYQPPSSTPARSAPSQSNQDSVQLSKTAQAALASADADHDGDSH